MRFLSNLLASVLGTFIALGVVFLFMILMFAAMIASSDPTPRVRTSSVLVVNLDNAVPELTSADPFASLAGGSAAFDLLDFRGALQKAAADDRIDAVWLKFRTYQPGGSWGMLYELHSALEAFKETSGKPIYASSDDYGMDEASYFLASVADSVFVSPGSIFEYNGFYMSGTFFARALDMLDVETQVLRTGEYKSAADQFTAVEFSPENEEQLRAYLDTMNDVFMSSVGRHRGLEEEELRRIASNDPILTAEDAHAAGLVDMLAYPDEVEARIKSRLGLDADDDLRTITMQRYARVPASEVGLGRGRDGDIAIVYARGAIVSGRSDDSPFGGSSNLGADTFNDAIREAREDDAVKAVVLRIDSPGGSASASEAMRREIELTAAEKPVIVSMGSLAASGGYWIAMAGDEIFATPTTITGSIGVIGMLFDISGFLENKLGVTYDVVRTSPYADFMSGMRSLNPQEEEVMQAFIDTTYSAFLNLVATSRNMDVARVGELAQGRIWSGRDAAELGLIDGVGNIGLAIERAAERAELESGTYSLRVLPRPKTVIEMLSEGFAVEAQTALSYLTTSRQQREIMATLSGARSMLREATGVQARMPLQLEVR